MSVCGARISCRFVSRGVCRGYQAGSQATQRKSNQTKQEKGLAPLPAHPLQDDFDDRTLPPSSSSFSPAVTLFALPALCVLPPPPTLIPRTSRSQQPLHWRRLPRHRLPDTRWRSDRRGRQHKQARRTAAVKPISVLSNRLLSCPYLWLVGQRETGLTDTVVSRQEKRGQGRQRSPAALYHRVFLREDAFPPPLPPPPLGHPPYTPGGTAIYPYVGMTKK